MTTKMSAADADKYMNALMSGKISLTGMEAMVFQRFGAGAKKLEGLDRDLRQAQSLKAELENRIKMLQAEIQKSSGDNEACADLLLSAEQARRDANEEDSHRDNGKQEAATA